jgi:hypothetical protein
MRMTRALAAIAFTAAAFSPTSTSADETRTATYVVATRVSPALAAGHRVHPAGAKAHALRWPLTAPPVQRGFVLRQDLFDRADPNNLRSDWPTPPAQPGQF